MKQKSILLSGGGTAGHITPVLHVAKALKDIDTNCHIVYILEKNSRFKDLVDKSTSIDEVKYIRAGKWRRFNNTGKLEKLLDFKTNFLNIVDLFKVLAGTIQMLIFFFQHRPGVVFAKGGFVVVPVGLASKVYRVPLLTHDSDRVPGLANRIISRWARLRTVANEDTASGYNNLRTEVVGIPVDERYLPTDGQRMQAARHELGAATSGKLMIITGGSLGAHRMNQALKIAIPKVIRRFNDLKVVWVGGEANLSELSQWLANQSEIVQSKISLYGFVDNLPVWFSAADLVVSRGGATALAEITASEKPSVIVPAGFLPDGHQSDNAEFLEKNDAVLVVKENDNIDDYARSLETKVIQLLKDDNLRSKLSSNLRELHLPNARRRIAELIYTVVNEQ